MIQFFYGSLFSRISALHFWLVSCSPQPQLQFQASRAMTFTFQFLLSLLPLVTTLLAVGFHLPSKTNSPRFFIPLLIVKLLVFTASIALIKFPGYLCEGHREKSSSSHEGHRLSRFFHKTLAAFHDKMYPDLFPLADFRSLEIVSLGMRVCHPTARSLAQYIFLKCNHTVHLVPYTEKTNYSRFLV